MSVPDPITREETYLAAIAGDDVTVPSPVTRPEDFLKAIDDHIGDVEDDVTAAEAEIDALQAIVPTPAAADSGKVLTAGADGTGSWQAASGGGGVFDLIVEISITFDEDTEAYVINSVSETHADIIAAQEAGKLIAGKIVDTSGAAYLAEFDSLGVGSTVRVRFTAHTTSLSSNAILYNFIGISGTSDADWACNLASATVAATISS